MRRVRRSRQFEGRRESRISYELLVRMNEPFRDILCSFDSFIFLLDTHLLRLNLSKIKLQISTRLLEKLFCLEGLHAFTSAVRNLNFTAPRDQIESFKEAIAH